MQADSGIVFIAHPTELSPKLNDIMSSPKLAPVASHRNTGR